MSDFVLDANVALAWYLDASPEQKAYAGKVMDLMIGGAIPAVPSLFTMKSGLGSSKPSAPVKSTPPP